MKKKLFSIILILSISINLVLGAIIIKINKQDSNSNQNLNKNININKITQNSYSIKEIDEKTKISIAKDLFDNYINSNMMDWQYVKNNKLDRKPVLSFTDYKIVDVFFVKEDDISYTVDIIYDIQYTNDSPLWVAGDGNMSENNWILKKDFLIDIIKYKDKYYISNVYH